MPIGNITQTMSTISPPPHRGVDVQTVFVNKQEDFQDHLADITIDELNTFKDQLNSRIGEINSTATTMNEYATSASSSASTATTKAGEASTSATAALNSKNQASTSATNSSDSATKSSQWANNNYNVAVEAGKYSAKHWATEAQNVVLNKVTKVASTDNAIVRFDGTTGDVQNSGVIINDNGQIVSNLKTIGGVGYNVNTSTFIANTLASGAVIERGSNANGSYIKFADGTLICTYVATVADQVVATAYGALFVGTRLWTFPSAFISAPTVIAQGKFDTQASWNTTGDTTTTTTIVYFIDVVSRGTGYSTVLNFIAIGNWK